jgi:membrane fusion protein (multidrug efflux system)
MYPMIKSFSKWLAVVAAVAVLVLVFMFTGQKIAQQANKPLADVEESAQVAEVSVVTVTTAAYTPTIEAYGSAEAYYQLSLTSEVAGKVVKLSDQFDAGFSVKEGDVLVQLGDSAYQSALAEAKNNLASAEVDYLEAQREAEQAKIEWKSSGLTGEPASSLVLYEPQLKAAKAALDYAKRQVISAQHDLNQTKIKAPFDGLVVSRDIAKGSYISANGEVGSLYSIDRVEIELPLSQRTLSNLETASALDSGKQTAQVSSVESLDQWTGYVRRIEKHLDEETRQQSIVLAVDAPLEQTPALYPGTFVKAQIQGRSQEGVWKLPTSSLSQRGEVWYVADALLKKFSAEAVASETDAIYIRPPSELVDQKVQVLVQPLSSYVDGMKVSAVEVDHE